VGYGLGAVWGAVVDDYEFPVDVAGVVLVWRSLWRWVGGKIEALFFECLCQKPCYDGEVAALVVGREEDGVFVA
jgi:hypothetical protein